MKLLHQVGHRWIWNLDSYFDHSIWDGFIFNAFTFPEEKIWWDISGYKFNDFKDISFLDLQFFGWNASIDKWNLDTYSFHPTHSEQTMSSETDLIFKWIDYQIEKWFKKIIIPNAYYKIEETEKIIHILKVVNWKLKNTKIDGIKYYMTIPLNNEILSDKKRIEDLLLALTNIDIIFDWYYIACEAKPQTRKKINDSYSYYESLYEIFNTLKKQDFEIIYAYANFDALVFYSLVDIDYISFWSYENLRNFDITRFSENEKGWWPSDWWYFSEKLLNMIKAKEVIRLKTNNVVDLIRNENNIFSDEILTDWYIWNTHKSWVHKNYLLSIFNLFRELSNVDIQERKLLMLSKVRAARELYLNLEDRWFLLLDENSDYHLSTWLSFLKSIK